MQGTSSLREHFKNIHAEALKADSSDAGGNRSGDNPSNASNSDAGHKRAAGTMAKLYELCPKKRRNELFQSTIPGWVETRNELSFHGVKAQKFHKAIFEMLVIDLLPFYEVAKPGFLRLAHQMHPNFTVASPTYYRSQLEPTYDAVKAVLSEKLKSEAPQTIAIGLDLWSQFHAGYLGLNGHYLTRDWKRSVFNMACVPFTESHTGEHIYEHLVLSIVDWDIIEQVGPCLRDNASNVVAAFKVIQLNNSWLSWKSFFRLSQHFNCCNMMQIRK